MKITPNPTAALVSQYLMTAALPLGIFFIAEYVVSMLATRSVAIATLRLPLMVITPVALFVLLRRLRDRVLSGMIGGRQAWVWGVQLMLFAGLIEAAFIYVYNEFIVPGNLETLHNAALAQAESVVAQAEQMPNAIAGSQSLINLAREVLQQMAESPIATPIQAAINQLSSDLFIGMLLMLFIAPAVRRRMPQ